MRMLYSIFLALVLAVLTTRAQEPRTALVVGCDYAGTSLQLPSPGRDARNLAAVLKNPLGFEVTVLPNPSRKQLLDAMDEFGATLGRRGGVGLFYFSGHGAQNEGDNYLIPAGANIGYREDLPSEAVSAERVITRMEAAGNRVNLLFLDACRNNAFPSAKQKGSFAKGLAGMNAANGMLLGFATARNTVANDSGEGSLYTNALLRHITTPGLSVTDMLTRVNAEVRKVSGGTQVPFMEVGLSDVFAFIPGGGASVPIPPQPTPVVPRDPVASASKDIPFENSLGMKFVPAGTPGVLFSVWETRVRDFEEFIQRDGYDMSKGDRADTLESGGWKQAGGNWRNPRFPQPQGEDHPVTCVSLNDAKAFCEWLTMHERRLGVLPPGARYRLPTDAEWSLAVGDTVYPWGNQWPPPPGAGNYAGNEANIGAFKSNNYATIPGYADGHARTAPAGSFASNRYGLFDMGGNVWEWCDSLYKASMNSADALKEYPFLKEEKASDGTPYRVLRGGSWDFDAEIGLRSSCRNGAHPAFRRDNVGFRCVLVVSGG